MTFDFDGEPVAAQPGQTIAAALLADGRRVLRHTRGTGAPRGIFCGIGACFDCLVVVNGRPGVYGSSVHARAPGDVLTWLQGPLTVRIEGAGSLEQALELARTLR